MKITSVHFSYYAPTHHGLTVKILGKIPKNNNLNYSSINLNLHGKFWKSLPTGLDHIVKWSYMPLSLIPTYWKKVIFYEKLYDDSNAFTVEIQIGTKEFGQFGISRQTLFAELKKMSKNTSVLEIEFRCLIDKEMKPFFSLFTTIPLIFDSLENENDAMFEGPIPLDLRTPSFLLEFYEYFRWGFWPLFFLIFLVFSCYDPEFFTSKMPKIFFTEKLNTNIIEKLAPCPETLSQSWRISRLEHEYGLLEENNMNLSRMNEILSEIGLILGRTFISTSEIHSIYQEILHKENEVGLNTQVKGLFNFINLIWFSAILGIVISIGPCVYHIIKPLRTALWEVTLYIWHYIIIPLHNNGFWEMLSYLICMSFVIEGFRYSSESGFYIALTGLFGSFAANSYTYFLRAKIRPDKGIYVLYNLLFSIYMIPLTVYYQSNLIAWLSVLCFYQALGFSFICCGLCYYIGFGDKEAMMRVSITSSIIGMIFIGLKAFKVSNYFIEPFAVPLTLSSAIVLLLALLIFSSYYYPSYRCYLGKKYLLRQIPMIFCLVGFLFFGNLFHMVGLVNTATVYLVFYLMEKYCDLHCLSNWNHWVLVFFFSVIIYKGALHLHENPEILFSMLNFNKEN